MRIYRVEELVGAFDAPTVVCLGVFDGVHLGHRGLITEALKIAQDKDLLPLVHTYDPLPFSVIYPDKPLVELTTFHEKALLLEELGIGHLAVSRFTDALQHIAGEAFFREVLLGRLNAKHLVVGFNHRFGYRGDTDVKKLKELCDQAGVCLTVIEPVRTSGGSLISSTAIRAAIMLEDFELAEEMLGRPPGKNMIGRLLNNRGTETLKQVNGGFTE